MLILFCLMLSNLFSTLLLVADPCMDRCKPHPLDFILLIVFSSTLSGCNSCYDIEDYAEYWQDDHKRLYKTLTDKDIIHDIPSHDSLNRAISLLQPEVFEEAYNI